MCEESSEYVGNDKRAGIVKQEMLDGAMAEQRNPKRGYDPLGTEPVLRSHLHDEMLKVCGRMSLCGVPTSVVRGVRMDMERLIDLTIATLQSAYRDMWNGLLPTVDECGLKVRVAKVVDGQEQDDQ